ncbi:riboflavin biosynthesis protein RibF [Aquibacillus kalidii]|uniref:riboflavin biosynthesis protein RibF n=1 Tax=Aquibacillus kalidii TaxID=2762597 RepID=UPI001645DBAC|nr:riboflavin biosynthesis protein RibF [Aquibacillus kalidii]
MEVIRLTYPHQLCRHQLPNTVAAIGFFDGIHRGHQKVIQTAHSIAKDQGKESAVITFTPHPSVVLRKDKQHASYITPLIEKQRLLEQMGIDRLYVITFNLELSKLSPQVFIDDFIIGLNITSLVAGFDFSYGHMGKGSMNTIEEHSRGKFKTTVVGKVQEDLEKISSTRIRKHLLSGNIEAANDLLGRPLKIRGVVVEGDKRGRTIGYPTANIQPADNYFFPKVGVYAVAIKVEKNRYFGMANLGYKPTFQENRELPSIEVHIFDYKEDIYGKELVIEWKKYIRDERKLSDTAELFSQLKADEKEVRSYFNVETL